MAEHECKVSVKGLAVACGVLWGCAVLLVGIANLIWPGYGEAFLGMVASIYPGYEVVPSAGSVILGTVYALIDGAVGGCLLALLYNCFKNCPCGQKKEN